MDLDENRTSSTFFSFLWKNLAYNYLKKFLYYSKNQSVNNENKRKTQFCNFLKKKLNFFIWNFFVYICVEKHFTNYIKYVHAAGNSNKKSYMTRLSSSAFWLFRIIIAILNFVDFQEGFYVVRDHTSASSLEGFWYLSRSRFGSLSLFFSRQYLADELLINYV